MSSQLSSVFSLSTHWISINVQIAHEHLIPFKVDYNVVEGYLGSTKSSLLHLAIDISYRVITCTEFIVQEHEFEMLTIIPAIKEKRENSKQSLSQ